MKKHGIFRKVFSYTLIFLLLTICVAAFLFAQQFKSFYDNSQMKQLGEVFQPLSHGLEGKHVDEILKIADDFYQKNQSFVFRIETLDGETLYTTPNAFQTDQQGYTLMITLPENLVLRATNMPTTVNMWNDMTQKIIFALTIMFMIAIAGALLFAKWMTNPIRKLAEETKKMALLEVVPSPARRDDEVGQLANDVHAMYEKLKTTISELEHEIELEKEMEENQRYFFSAASHELKTPIAATKALIEGMIAGVGDYTNHPKYLHECLKMLNAQNKIVSEILDIVNLSNEKVQPVCDKIDLSVLITSVTQEYFTIAESRGQTLTIDIPQGIICYADKNMLGRAISNIIMNAIQNAPDNEFVKVWREKRGTAVRLFILNTNSHIDEAIDSKLFEPFYRVDKARSRSVNRSGLGLTLVKRMLDKMNIAFSLENSGNDVLFWMELATGK